MPELPEVQTIAAGLALILPGRVIKSVDFDFSKSFPNDPEPVSNYLLGASVVSVERRGKAILIDLSSHYSLLIHLKMTGQLVYQSQDNAHNPPLADDLHFPDKSTRVTITFQDDSRLYFNDQRKFGYMRLLPTAQAWESGFVSRLGPEPLSPAFTPAIFRRQLQKRPGTSIKAALLDQSVIAGIGNIYADESLFVARIRPDQKTASLTLTQRKRLYQAIQQVLRDSIEAGGSTRRNYLNAQGGRGTYLDQAYVYNRQGAPCRHCGKTIEKTKVAGRGTHYCPSCQKLPRARKPSL